MVRRLPVAQPLPPTQLLVLRSQLLVYRPSARNVMLALPLSFQNEK